MKRATLFVTVLLALFAVGIGVRWAFDSTGAAAPTGNMTCSVKASCDAGEVEVLRLSDTTNAHAGTPVGSGYAYSVCCREVCNLSTDCTDVYATVLTLSSVDNAHAAADGSYASQVCLSVPYGVADCSYGPTCDAGYECVATVSGSANAHVADCDGDADDYGTKLCCRIVNDCDNNGTLDPDDPDDDGDTWDDWKEDVITTDSCDACPDVTGTPGLCPGPSCDGDDAWPPDLDVNRTVNILDVLQYKPVLGGAYDARFDLDASGAVNILDVLLYKPVLNASCTNP